MDNIGIMYAPVAEEDQNPVALEGWHVNTPNAIEGWDAYAVIPTVPRRVYAGHPTFFYVFASEEEFVAKATEAGLLPKPEPEPVPLVEGEE